MDSGQLLVPIPFLPLFIELGRNYLGEIRREQQLRLVTYQAGPLEFLPFNP